MKNLKQLLIIVLLFSTCTLFAQKKVALQSNGTTTIFAGANPFTDAYNAAADGDTLYLPGGNLLFPSTIDKELFIIGAGHYPDSTTATAKTFLNGNLTISQNADNLHLEGIEVGGTINFSNNHKVDSVIIKRCKFNQLVYSGSRTTACKENEIIECVIEGEINLANAESCLISNCILAARIMNG